MKRCSKCKIEKVESDFRKDHRLKTGLQSQCKLCQAEHAKGYYQVNRTRLIEKGKKYYHENRTEILEKQQTPAAKEARRKYNEKSCATIRGYLQRVFVRMLYRCNNPVGKDYKNYGRRGIRVCFDSSEDFLDYVINELKVDPRGLQIDRINNGGNYERGNIRFVTHLENQQNKRPYTKKKNKNKNKT